MKSSSDKTVKIPSIAEKILRHILPEREREGVLGDFDEIYKNLFAENGKFRAKTWYWSQVLKFILPFIGGSVHGGIAMLKNYVKIAFRNIIKYKGFSAIKIFGFSAGIGASVLVFLFAGFILTSDSFHENKKRIFMVYAERNYANGTSISKVTPKPLVSELLSDSPLLETGSRVYETSAWISNGAKRFKQNIRYVDKDFLEMFTFPLITGKKDGILSKKNTIVISEELALKYFDNAHEAIGNILNVGYTVDYVINGVFHKIPRNSSLIFDALLPFANAEDLPYVQNANDYGNSFLSSFIQLREDAAPSDLIQHLELIVNNNYEAEEAQKLAFKLVSLNDLKFFTNNEDIFAYIFLGIAASLLFIATINFVNLTTARSMSRTHEIGVRKVLGARKRQLFKQFLVESIILSTVSTIIGVLSVKAFLPNFESFFGIELPNQLDNPANYIFLILSFGIGVGILAGIYPSLMISRFTTDHALKSSSKSGTKLRSLLSVGQFTASFVLVLVTYAMWKQLDFMQNFDTGVQRQNVIAIPVSVRDFQNVQKAESRLETFKQEIRKHDNVVAVASSLNIPGNQTNTSIYRSVPEGRGNENPLRIQGFKVGKDYFDVYDIRFIEGGNVSSSSTTEGQYVIVNETLKNMAGWDDAIGKTIRIGSSLLIVKGVVADYHYTTLRKQMMPLFHEIGAGPGTGHNNISVRITGEDVGSTIAFIQEQWRILDPEREFSYSFVEDHFENLYRVDTIMSSVSTGFSSIAIILASLGLLGLTILSASQRAKEISVRKVLGASVTSLVGLLSKNFAVLMLTAVLIGLPLSIMVTELFFQQFAYRTSLEIHESILFAVLMIGIAIFTISYQTLRSAYVNPAVTLRDE